MPDSPVIEASNRYRDELLRQDAAALGRMARAYNEIYRRLQSDIDALLLATEGQQLTRGQITRLSRYQALMQQTAEQLRQFEGYLTETINEQSQYGISKGEEHARFLMSTIIAGDGSIAAQFARLPTAAIQELLGFLAPDSSLYQRILELAPFTADLVSQEIVTRVAVGQNPTVIARAIESAFGQGLTNAMRMVRTVQLYSYREANRASYVANGDVVEGWYWHAQLDNGTCVSCINQHGNFYPLTQTLNDHHNGRCAMIPAVKGFPPPSVTIGEGEAEETITLSSGAGQQWFEKQPENVQRQMMGAGLYEAWRDGKVSFNQLSTNYDDTVYGTMRRVPTLKELTASQKQAVLSNFENYENAKRWLQDNLLSDPPSMYQTEEAIQGWKDRNVQVEGIPLDLLESAGTQFKMMRDKYGLPGLDEIKNESTGWSFAHYAEYTYGDTTIRSLNINRDFIKNLRDEDGMSVDDFFNMQSQPRTDAPRYFVSSNGAEAMRHEAAHYYHATHLGKNNTSVTRAYNAAVESGLLGNVSEYAMQNEAEFLAEMSVHKMRFESGNAKLSEAMGITDLMEALLP